MNKSVSKSAKAVGITEKMAISIAYVLLVLVILFSTWLHHIHPEVLRVPDVMNVSAWQNPTFEETLIYKQMTPAQRDKIRAEGVTDGVDLYTVFSNDIFMMLLGLLCFFHMTRHYSAWLASCFFIGSFVFTGLEESVWIIGGRILGGTFSVPAGGLFTGTYWFAKGGFWFFETPITACIGWFIFAHTCVFAVGKLFPNLSLLPRASIGGLIAMGLDLWTDPVQTAPELMNWIWASGDALIILGIPFYNFFGWFLMIFLFHIAWDNLPRMEEKWGRNRTTSIFFIFCICGGFFMAAFLLIVSILGIGSLLSLLGVTEAVHFPSGW